MTWSGVRRRTLLLIMEDRGAPQARVGTGPPWLAPHPATGCCPRHPACGMCTWAPDRALAEAADRTGCGTSLAAYNGQIQTAHARCCLWRLRQHQAYACVVSVWP